MARHACVAMLKVHCLNEPVEWYRETIWFGSGCKNAMLSLLQGKKGTVHSDVMRCQKQELVMEIVETKGHCIFDRDCDSKTDTEYHFVLKTVVPVVAVRAECILLVASKAWFRYSCLLPRWRAGGRKRRTVI